MPAQKGVRCSHAPAFGFKGDEDMTTMRIGITSLKQAIAFAVLASVLIRAGIASADPASAADPDAAKVQAAAKAAVAALEEKKSKFKPFAEVTKESKKY